MGAEDAPTVGPQQYAGEDEPGSQANVPVNSEVRQIPIMSAEGNEDQSTQLWRAENWEEDPDRARAMAEDPESAKAMEGHIKSGKIAKRLADETAGLESEAQELVNKGVLSREDTKGVDKLEEAAYYRGHKADQYKEHSEKLFVDAQKLADEAGQRYDIKKTIPENLEPLSKEESKKAEELRQLEAQTMKELQEAQQKYSEARALEDRIEGDRKAAVGIGIPTNIVLGEKASGKIEGAAVSYIKSLEALSIELREAIREHADQVLRKSETLKKTSEEIEQHYQENAGRYYDSALTEMTDEGIPLGNSQLPAETAEEAA